MAMRMSDMSSPGGHPAHTRPAKARQACLTILAGFAKSEIAGGAVV